MELWLEGNTDSTLCCEFTGINIRGVKKDYYTIHTQNRCWVAEMHSTSWQEVRGSYSDRQQLCLSDCWKFYSICFIQSSMEILSLCILWYLYKPDCRTSFPFGNKVKLNWTGQLLKCTSVWSWLFKYILKDQFKTKHIWYYKGTKRRLNLEVNTVPAIIRFSTLNKDCADP